MDGSFLTFLGVSIVVIVAPDRHGVDDQKYVARRTRAGIGTALGVSTGQLIWAVATSVGLVAVLLASEHVFRAVRLAGAAYLIWLGLHPARSSDRARSGGASRRDRP